MLFGRVPLKIQLDSIDRLFVAHSKISPSSNYAASILRRSQRRMPSVRCLLVLNDGLAVVLSMSHFLVA